MPKANPVTKAAAQKPYSRTPKSPKPTQPTTTNGEPTGRGKGKGKDSHLYTDDNPRTTLRGTGFKDAATARHTIALVSSRSLLYQFQTINTMYHRANHHPHSAGNSNMEGAMAVFRKWLDETYPAERAARVEYQPVLKRETVARFMGRVEQEEGNGGIDGRWARMYVGLEGKAPRLANVLWEEGRPEGDDMGTVRDRALGDITGGRIENSGEDLWDEVGKRVSRWHLQCIAYAWSPVGEARLKGLT